MPHNRFYASVPLTGTVELPEEEQRHLKVMRCQPGEAIEVIDGHGALAQGIVLEDKTVQIVSVKHYPKPKPFVQMSLAIPQAGHLDWMVEKLTELGVAKISLFPGKLSISAKVNLERVQRIVVAATKQCGRLYLPAIELLTQMEKPTLPSFFGDLEAQEYLQPGQDPVNFFIGPEKGFHPIELQLLHQWGVISKRLSINVLRAETAAVAAASILLLTKG